MAILKQEGGIASDAVAAAISHLEVRSPDRIVLVESDTYSQFYKQERSSYERRIWIKFDSERNSRMRCKLDDR